ncbi:MAG: hypothetical protein HC919_02110 [Oscillatoriales cyanobacterium SM2_2_1]|nr:hypothetical protein [Oscillatoriales cyanobacterium SM2_2_1]
MPDIEMVTELRELSIHERPTLIQSRSSMKAEPTLPDIEMVTELRSAIRFDEPPGESEPTLPDVELLTELRERVELEPEPSPTVDAGDRPPTISRQQESKLQILARWQTLCRRNPQFLDRPAIIQRLGQLSCDRDSEIRQQSLALLGRIPNGDVLSYLLAALRRDARSQKVAAKALSQLQNLPETSPSRPPMVYLRRSRKVVSL